jgi:two-component system, NarL family, response regulator DevR
MPMSWLGMDTNVRVLVLERGVTLTHDLTFACRHSTVSVLGPVRNVADADAARTEIPVDVLAVEIVERSVQTVREASEAFGGIRVIGVTEDPDPEIGASVIAAGGAGLMGRSDDERTVPHLLQRAAAGELILPATHLAALVELVRVSRLDSRDDARIDTLTRREREVLALFADGRTTQEVSDALSISVMTVQSHVKNVLAKLGVHSKVEAIRFAWRSGALSMPASA